jgi:hypothetical protein
MERLVAAEVKGIQGDPLEAEQDMRRAADGFAAVGDRFSYSICATHGAELAEMRGDYHRAVRMLEESLAIAETSASRFGASPPDRDWPTWRSSAATSPSRRRCTNRRSIRPPGRYRNGCTRSRCSAWPTSPAGAADPTRHSATSTSPMELPRSKAAPLILSTLLVSRGYSADLGRRRPRRRSSPSTRRLRVALQLGAARVTANAVEGWPAPAP